ncbi:unnamed protein product [Camellia sinensis]
MTKESSPGSGREAKMVEEALRILRFEEIPSSQDFSSHIESRNVPAVFNGCIKNWKAFSTWNPFNGGLDYLLERAGSFVVDAMLSRSAPVFYGDIRSHERVPLPFSTFIGYCNKHAHNSGRDSDVSFESERHGMEGCDTKQGCMPFGEAPQQIYLAQVPIMNSENEERVQLATLREDIQMPPFLETKELAAINLWMNNAQSRSSTHYDPHHNLLCIISVVLWPPSASPYLYPMPLYGEASNHSAVSLENPNLSIHTRAERSMEYSQKVILHAGDALFIPEGWFHQVDSDDLTIAINFWWRSNQISGMTEHMDAYYLRIILRRLTDKQMGQNQVLRKSMAGAAKLEKHTIGRLNNGQADENDHNFDEICGGADSKGNKINEKLTLHELEPLTLKALHELVSLVHDRVNIADQSEPVNSSSSNGSADGEKGQRMNFVKANLFCLEDDPVASILWSLHPLALQNVFLAMVHNFPRTLEALILHLLSPVGAEVLTQKFDEMDQRTAEEDRYMLPSSRLNSTNGKEAFAFQVMLGFGDIPSIKRLKFESKKSLGFDAEHICFLSAFKNVLDQYLGISFDGPKPSV